MASWPKFCSVIKLHHIRTTLFLPLCQLLSLFGKVSGTSSPQCVSLCKLCCYLWSSVHMLPNAALVHLCPCLYRKGEVMCIYKNQGLVNTIWYKSQVSFIRSVIPLGCNTANCCMSYVRKQLKATAISNDTSLLICVCCFPVAGTPMLPLASSWMQLMWAMHCLMLLELPSETWWARQGCVCWSLVCSSPGDSVINPELLIHSLRDTSSTALHCPTGNSSASAGSQWWDTVHNYSSSSSCAGKNKFSGIISACEV